MARRAPHAPADAEQQPAGEDGVEAHQPDHGQCAGAGRGVRLRDTAAGLQGQPTGTVSMPYDRPDPRTPRRTPRRTQ